VPRATTLNFSAAVRGGTCLELSTDKKFGRVQKMRSFEVPLCWFVVFWSFLSVPVCPGCVCPGCDCPCVPEF